MDPLHVKRKADVATLSSAILLVHVLLLGSMFDEDRNTNSTLSETGPISVHKGSLQWQASCFGQ